MFMLTKKPASRGHREYRLPRLLSTQGAGTYNQKSSSTVEPCFEYASYPIAFRLADEIDSDTYTDVATTMLRRLYSFGVTCLRDTPWEDASMKWGEGPVEVQDVVEAEAERAERADEEVHEEACGGMAMAMAQPVSMPADEPPLDIVRLRAARPEPAEVIKDAKSPAEPVKEESRDESDATDSDSDSDEDSDSDSESSDDGSEGSVSKSSSTSSTSSFFTRPVLRRSPLSQSTAGMHPVYAGYHCTIEGCSFKASTPQHVRHHMLTASHWYLLED